MVLIGGGVALMLLTAWATVALTGERGDERPRVRAARAPQRGARPPAVAALRDRGVRPAGGRGDRRAPGGLPAAARRDARGGRPAAAPSTAPTATTSATPSPATTTRTGSSSTRTRSSGTSATTPTCCAPRSSGPCGTSWRTTSGGASAGSGSSDSEARLGPPGEVTERLKVHDWKSCGRVKLPRGFESHPLPSISSSHQADYRSPAVEPRSANGLGNERHLPPRGTRSPSELVNALPSCTPSSRATRRPQTATWGWSRLGKAAPRRGPARLSPWWASRPLVA